MKTTENRWGIMVKRRTNGDKTIRAWECLAARFYLRGGQESDPLFKTFTTRKQAREACKGRSDWYSTSTPVRVLVTVETVGGKR